MSFLVRFSLAFAFCLLAAPMRGQYVYATASINNAVFAYSIGTGGALTEVGAFTTGRQPYGIAVDHTGSYVYVANFGDDTLSGYSIGPGGALSPVAGSPFATGSGPYVVAADPRGPYVYVSNNPANTVSGFKIGSGGVLTAISGSPFPTGNDPEGLAINPYGKYLNVTNRGDGTFSRYSIGAGGVLSPVAGSPFTTGPQPLGIAASNSHVFVANGFIADTLSVYGLNSSGQLTPITGSPFKAVPVGLFYIAVDSQSRFLYVTDVSDLVLAYTIDKGALTLIGSFATGTPPFGLALDTTDSYLYVASAYIPGGISGYSVGTDGSLTPITGSPFGTGTGLEFIATAP